MRLCHDVIVYLQVVALLAFSTTAGFRTLGPDDNRVNCMGFNNTPYRAVLNFRYPMDSQDFFFTYSPSPPPNATENGCPQSMPFQAFNGRSGYFVAMGVLSMIYVIAAIVVYMLFLIPDLFIVKWLVIGVSKKLYDSSGDSLALYLYLPFLSPLLFLPLSSPLLSLLFLLPLSSPFLLFFSSLSPFPPPPFHPPFFLSSSSPLLLPLSFPSLLSSFLQDFIATILIGVLYLLADISWSSGVADLPGFVRSALRDVATNCLQCNPIIDENEIIVQTFAQLAISLVRTCMLLLKGKRMQ